MAGNHHSQMEEQEKRITDLERKVSEQENKVSGHDDDIEEIKEKVKEHEKELKDLNIKHAAIDDFVSMNAEQLASISSSQNQLRKTIEDHIEQEIYRRKADDEKEEELRLLAKEGIRIAKGNRLAMDLGKDSLITHMSDMERNLIIAARGGGAFAKMLGALTDSFVENKARFVAGLAVITIVLGGFAAVVAAWQKF